MTTKTKRSKFIALGIVLALVLVAGLGATVWYAYHSSQLADQALQSANKVSNDVPKLPVIDSYATCQKAPGSKQLLTYPAQCVTTSGKTFTDNSQKYLVIKEWGVKVALNDPAITDAVYTAPKSASSSAPGVESVDLATKNTLKMDFTCGGLGSGVPTSHSTGDDQDALLRAKTVAELRLASNNSPDTFVHVGGYYYAYQHNTGHGPCGITDSTLAAQAQAAAIAFGKAPILAE